MVSKFKDKTQENLFCPIVTKLKTKGNPTSITYLHLKNALVKENYSGVVKGKEVCEKVSASSWYRLFKCLISVPGWSSTLDTLEDSIRSTNKTTRVSTPGWRIIVCSTTFITKNPKYLHTTNQAAVFATYVNWKYSFHLIKQSLSVPVGATVRGSSYKTVRMDQLFDLPCRFKNSYDWF